MVLRRVSCECFSDRHACLIGGQLENFTSEPIREVSITGSFRSGKPTMSYKGAEKIVEVAEKIRTIQVLNLAGNTGVSDRASGAFARMLAETTTLEYLNLSYTQVNSKFGR